MAYCGYLSSFSEKTQDGLSIFCKKLCSIKCHFKTCTKLLLKRMCIFRLLFLDAISANRTNYVKRAVSVHLVSALLLVFLINYSVFAQPEELSDKHQGDVLDFAGLTTSIGPEPSNEITSDQQVPNGETVEVELAPADFSPIRESSSTAREAMQNNDPIAAYSALSSAENLLFGVSNRVASNSGEMNMTEESQQLNSLQRHIDGARDALVNRDNIKAMEEANSLDIELFNITGSLEEDEG